MPVEFTYNQRPAKAKPARVLELPPSTTTFVDYSETDAKRFVSQNQKFVGKKVALFGGGSFGEEWIVKLVKLEAVPNKSGNDYGIRATLKGNTPTNTPWLGSWKLAVFER